MNVHVIKQLVIKALSVTTQLGVSIVFAMIITLLMGHIVWVYHSSLITILLLLLLFINPFCRYQ